MNWSADLQKDVLGVVTVEGRSLTVAAEVVVSAVSTLFIRIYMIVSNSSSVSSC